MLDIRKAEEVNIIGGGTAGWMAALTFRKMFQPNVNIRVIEAPEIGIVGVGEGGLINLISALNKLKIPIGQFMKETGASFKWGFCYEGWRNGKKDDEFYHLFINPSLPPFNKEVASFFPLISGNFFI